MLARTTGRSSGSSFMDTRVSMLAIALRRFTFSSPSWPRGETLERAEAGAKDLLSFLCDEL
eukprot:11200726-Lingulodinium_polyedra.AAC.1